MTSPPHIRHCIDLIRDAQIYQPDIITEVKNEEGGCDRVWDVTYLRRLAELT